MRLGTKLLCLQIPLAVAVVVVALLAQFSVDELGEQSALILRRNYRHKDSAHTTLLALTHFHALVAADGRDVSNRDAELASLRDTVETSLRLHEHEPVSDAEIPYAKAVSAAWEPYLAESGAPRTDSPTPTREGRWRPATLPTLRRVTAALERLWQFHDEGMRARSRQQAALAKRLGVQSILAAIAAMLVGILVSARIARSISGPVVELAGASRRIASGNFDVQLHVGSRDEIAQLAEDFTAMAAELKRQSGLSIDELARSRNALQATIDGLSDAVVLFSPAGEPQTWNERARALLDLNRSEGVESAAVDAALHADVERVRVLVGERGEPHLPVGFEDAVRVEGEGEAWLLTRATPVRGTATDKPGVCVTVQDVTRWRRFDELKTDMVATVSHELRTPLTSLQMSLALCEDGVAGPISEKQAILLRTARTEAERLRTMIEDLLDLARLQAGRLELRRSEVNVHELLAEHVERFRPDASAKEISLALDAGPLPTSVSWDGGRVGLVVANLLSNAIRYTPEHGRVVLEARADDTHVRFRVTDSGPGIPAEYQHTLFDKFFRVPGSPKGGTGLGLWIAQQIIRAHGGEMRVDSEPGQGASFDVTLPIAEPADDEK